MGGGGVGSGSGSSSSSPFRFRIWIHNIALAGECLAGAICTVMDICITRPDGLPV
jgi:hypothetical protein